MRKKEFDSTAEIYLDRLLEKYFKEWEEKMNAQVIEDLVLVQKYKGELAKSLEAVRGQRNTLNRCMQEIIQTQNELKSLALDLIRAIKGEYPRVMPYEKEDRFE